MDWEEPPSQKHHLLASKKVALSKAQFGYLLYKHVAFYFEHLNPNPLQHHQQNQCQARAQADHNLV